MTLKVIMIFTPTFVSLFLAVASGCRTGAIHHHDVRVAQHQVGAVLGHSQEVCGLQWSPSGNFLASGGNDNLLNIWRCDPGSNLTGSNSLYSFNQHQAAVKVTIKQ